jgi:hypothetical protein
MPEPSDIDVQPGKSLRAIALMVVLSLLAAVGWSVAVSAAQGSTHAAPADRSQAPPGAGSGSQESNPPPGKFYLPRQLFVEVSRAAPRDPPMPPPAMPLTAPTAITAVPELFVPDRTWRIRTPAEGVGRSTPRTPTGPPVSA